jgi:hypothetical protein
MGEYRDQLVNWLRAEFAAEQASGFARLKLVPDTRVIRFLDHFSSLEPARQQELAAVLADWASYRLCPTPLP